MNSETYWLLQNSKGEFLATSPLSIWFSLPHELKHTHLPLNAHKLDKSPDELLKDEETANILNEFINNYNYKLIKITIDYKLEDI